MLTFNEFIQSRDIQEQDTVSAPKWKATKSQILNYWKILRSNEPILMRPIPYAHSGSTYGEDGIRITGSPQFIASILGRIKDIQNYETKNTKLQVVYRQTEASGKNLMNELKTSYVFYITVRERGAKKPPQQNLNFS